jgi:hypothetical protein
MMPGYRRDDTRVARLVARLTKGALLQPPTEPAPSPQPAPRSCNPARRIAPALNSAASCFCGPLCIREVGASRGAIRFCALLAALLLVRLEAREHLSGATCCPSRT